MRVIERRAGNAPCPSLQSAIIKRVRSASTEDARGRYRLSADVLLVTVYDGTARLVDLSDSVFTLSETGAAMLEAALDGRQREGCDALAECFKIDPAQIEADMAALLRDLEAQRLIAPPGVRARRRPTMGRMLCWTIAPIVLGCARSRGRWTAAGVWILLTTAYLTTRLFGWTSTLSVWWRCLARERPSAPTMREDQLLGLIDARVTRAIARHPLNMGCKERALCCWALARGAGLPGKLVLGVDLFPFGLHCWCESGSRILADRYEGRCDRYTPIMAYG